MFLIRIKRMFQKKDHLPLPAAALAAILELTVHNEGYARLMCSSEFVRAGHFDGAVRGAANDCWLVSQDLLELFLG